MWCGNVFLLAAVLALASAQEAQLVKGKLFKNYNSKIHSLNKIVFVLFYENRQTCALDLVTASSKVGPT